MCKRQYKSMVIVVIVPYILSGTDLKLLYYQEYKSLYVQRRSKWKSMYHRCSNIYIYIKGYKL